MSEDQRQKASMSEASRTASAKTARSHTIRSRIVTLVLLILLPLLLVFAWLTLNIANAKREFIELQRASITDVVASRVDNEIARDLGMLTSLAVSMTVMDDSFTDFQRQARSLTTQPNVNRVWTFSRIGTVAVVTRSGAAADTAGDQEMIARVFNGEQVVSAVQGEGLTDTTVTIALPVSRKDKIVAGLAAAIHVKNLSEVFADAGMNPSWVAGIVDSNGRFVARSLDAGKRVGKSARPELVAAALSKRNRGVFENTTFEGVEMMNSFRRSSLTGWTTVVAVPREMVNAPLFRSIVVLVLTATAVVILTLMAAFAFANRISEPVRNLGQIATAVAQGRPFARPRYPLVELNDVIKAFETATAKSAHLAALVASSGDAIISIDLDGNIATWNRAAEELFGYKAEEVIGRPKSLLVPAENMGDFEAQQAETLKGNSSRVETTRRRRDGSRIRVSINAAPIRNPAGKIIGMSSILHDVSERIALEENRHILMRELAHRSKNQLAIVQSIARRTAKGTKTPQDFLERFGRRLQALSASQDLLMKQNWKGAPLADLARIIFDGFIDRHSDRIAVSGPDVSVNSSAAEAIGLALNELATNSMKYGALSVPSGQVSLVWKELADGSERGSWELCWRETGGPAVTKPDTSGFGSEVIERVVAMAVNGKAELRFKATGLQWRLVFPAEVLVAA